MWFALGYPIRGLWSLWASAHFSAGFWRSVSASKNSVPGGRAQARIPAAFSAERVSLKGRVAPHRIPGDLLRLRADETPCSNKALILPCAAGRAIEVMQVSQPAAISTSGGRLEAFTRR